MFKLSRDAGTMGKPFQLLHSSYAYQDKASEGYCANISEIPLTTFPKLKSHFEHSFSSSVHATGSLSNNEASLYHQNETLPDTAQIFGSTSIY
jgi:hypothetical protein